MSSNSTSAQRAEQLFDERLVPLAAANPQVHLTFTAQPSDDDSYYRAAFRPVLNGTDMAFGGEHGELAELRAYWERTNPVLLELMPDIEAIANELAEERRARLVEEPDAPSTLIYQMW